MGVTRDDLAVLSFKLIGVYLMLSLVDIPQYFGWSIAGIFQNSFQGSSVLSIIGFIQLLITAGVGLCIWIQANALSKKIFPNQDAQGTAVDVNRRDLFLLALRVMGVWLVATTIPSIVSTSAHYLFPYREESLMGSPASSNDPRILQSLLALLVKAAIGSLLILWTPAAKSLKGLLSFNHDLPLTPVAAQKKCPYCRNVLEGSQDRVCPECGVRYHAACWLEHGGCGIFGCAAAKSG